MDQQKDAKLPSKLIKVNNLPFSTTDEQFQNLFKDFEIQSANIIKRKGRSKGIGYVHLLKESDQKPIIEKINNIELEQRRLLATIAYEPKESDSILYVSNIPWSYGNEEFKNLFKDYDVKSATVVLSRTGRSRGFGFVEFNTTEDQQRALKLDNTKVEERVITVRVSKKDDESTSKETPIKTSNNKEYSLFVNNLPFDLDENDMLQIFADFNVKGANIPSRNGRSKGFGYVEFSNATDMNNALVALDQSVINDRLVEVKLATDKPSKGDNGKSGGFGGKNTNNIRNKNKPKKESSQTILHVSNLPYSFDDNQLSALFSDFKVVKSNIVKNLNGTSAGHAFVEFESHEEQQRAYKAKNRNQIDGRKFFLQPAWNNNN